jgi:hypothetical protein
VAKRKRQTSVPKKVLEGHRRIWGGRIPAGALAQLKREYAKNPARVENAGKYSYRKTKKLLNKHGYGTKSSARQKYVTKSGKAGSFAARTLVDHHSKKQNPPMKKLKKSTGWMAATAVKIVKRGGKIDVLISKPAGKKTKKRR